MELEAALPNMLVAAVTGRRRWRWRQCHGGTPTCQAFWWWLRIPQAFLPPTIPNILLVLALPTQFFAWAAVGILLPVPHQLFWLLVCLHYLFEALLTLFIYLQVPPPYYMMISN